MRTVYIGTREIQVTPAMIGQPLRLRHHDACACGGKELLVIREGITCQQCGEVFEPSRR